VERRNAVINKTIRPNMLSDLDIRWTWLYHIIILVHGRVRRRARTDNHSESHEIRTHTTSDFRNTTCADDNIVKNNNFTENIFRQSSGPFFRPNTTNSNPRKVGCRYFLGQSTNLRLSHRNANSDIAVTFVTSN